MNMSIRDQVLEILRLGPATPKEMYDTIMTDTADKSKSISNALYSMKRKGTIVRLGKDTYQVNEPTERPGALNTIDVGRSIIGLVNHLETELKSLREYKEDCDQLLRDNVLLKERVAELTELINQVTEPALNLSSYK